MIKQLTILDPTNFNNNVWKNLKFTDVALIGPKYEIIDNLTVDDKSKFNNYMNNINKFIKSETETYINPKVVNPAHIPSLGNKLDILLHTFGTSLLLMNITKEYNTMYVVVVNKIPKICKVTSTNFNPLKIDIIYDNCPYKMWIDNKI